MQEKSLPSVLNTLFNEQEIPNELKLELQQEIIHKKVKKGDILQRRGDLHMHTYVVVKGCLRSYSVDEKGKEHIFMFAPEGWVISDIESVTTNQPAQLFIDALEDSEVEVFDQRIFEKAVKALPATALMQTPRLMKRISVLQKRIIMLMSASALERYKDFLDTYPDIVQRVPQKMIASYLGITPEALSKIRARQTGRKTDSVKP